MKNCQLGFWSADVKPPETDFKPHNSLLHCTSYQPKEISNTPLLTPWDPNWLSCTWSKAMRRASYLLHCVGVQGGKHSTSHRKQWHLCFFWGLCVFYLLLFFLSNLVCRQNLSLERVEGRFPRDMRQSGEMICLRHESVENYVSGSFQGSWGNSAINPAENQRRQVSVELYIYFLEVWARLKIRRKNHWSNVMCGLVSNIFYILDIWKKILL